MHARMQAAHSAPTLAFRFDDLLTWCTDTVLDEGNVEFPRGCKVLAPKLGVPQVRRGKPRSTHRTAGGEYRPVGWGGTSQADPLHPLHDSNDVLVDAQARFPDVELAADGNRFPV